MPVTVRLAGGRGEKVPYPAGEDVAVDDIGTLAVTVGEGRAERVLAVWAAGAWLGADVIGAP